MYIGPRANRDISQCGDRNPPPAGKPKPVPAASFSFLFLLIFLFREMSAHLTKEKDKEEREKSGIVAAWNEVDQYLHTAGTAIQSA